MFVRTTGVNKVLALKARKRVIQGGTSASKSYAILAAIIDKAAKHPNKDISVVSESIPHLRRGVIKDFRKIMQSTGRWLDSSFHETHLTYKFSNGSIIEFFSADQEDKLRGARRHVLFVNEANNISFEAYHQLAIRTSEDIYIDFNPSESFWAHTEVATEDDAELLILTYKDNEALPESIVKDIEAAQYKAYRDPEGDRTDPKNIKSSYWANWWQVYGLGQIGALQGAIFDNWKQIDDLPGNARLIALGMDFGYTNDPTTLVAYYQHNGQHIWDEVIYKKGLLNSQIADLIKKQNIGSTPIYADSAEPKSIAELRGYGLNVIGATKGPGSVRHGISLLQDKEFSVTARSTNLIKELRHYTWETDRTGQPTNNPIDAHNHCIDGMRYVAQAKLTKTNSRAGFGVHMIKQHNQLSSPNDRYRY